MTNNEAKKVMQWLQDEIEASFARRKPFDETQQITVPVTRYTFTIQLPPDFWDDNDKEATP